MERPSVWKWFYANSTDILHIHSNSDWNILFIVIADLHFRSLIPSSFFLNVNCKIKGIELNLISCHVEWYSNTQPVHFECAMSEDGPYWTRIEFKFDLFFQYHSHSASIHWQPLSSFDYSPNNSVSIDFYSPCGFGWVQRDTMPCNSMTQHCLVNNFHLFVFRSIYYAWHGLIEGTHTTHSHGMISY